MKSNPIQFAVVREDPRLEEHLLSTMAAPRHVLLVGSGGCTALHLRARFPDLRITLFDLNPAQLELIGRKVDRLKDPPSAQRLRDFNVGSDDPAGLSQCGNFESLFRRFRGFLNEFVVDPVALEEALLQAPSPDFLAGLFANRYWPVAFELYFSEPLLNAMFGPDATQHAPKGSYPSYFREALERGLRRPDAPGNYFLHHILCGRYPRLDAAPSFLSAAPIPGSSPPIHHFHGDLFALEAAAMAARPEAPAPLADYDLIHLSNLFDWMNRDSITATLELLQSRMAPGAVVLLRQLNNRHDLRPLFGPAFTFDRELELTLLSADRSLFYNQLAIGVKQ